MLLLNPFFRNAIKIPSFGLGFIGTYVKRHSDWDVEVIEQSMQDITDEQLLERVKQSDILGLTCYTESRFEVFAFAAKARKANPHCIIIVGGPHVQTLDTQILKRYPFIDVVVRLEGEETVLDLVNNKPLREIPGITWRDQHGDIIRNPERGFIADFDDLEYDYALIAEQIAGWKDYEIPLELQKLNALPLIVSRGCPFKCTFCGSNQQWENSYRYISAEKLISKIEYYVKEYNIGYFRFYDALFIGSESRLLNFCDLLEKSGLKISFRIDVRVGTGIRVLKRLREVGCDVLGFGIESGSDRVLKRINKGITRKQIDDTIDTCKKLGYWIIGYFMISLPGETHEDIMKTYELLGCFDEANVQFFKIHPNTAFYNELLQKGEISDEAWFDPAGSSEIFYCTERFSGARMTKQEGDSLVSLAYSFITLHNTKKVLDAKGILKGSIIVLTAFIARILLTSPAGRKLYARIKRVKLIELIYKYLMDPGKRNVSVCEDSGSYVHSGKEAAGHDR